VDLIESGPQPPARTGPPAAVRVRRRLARVRPDRGPRRLGAIAATGLLCIGLLAGLRAGLDEPTGRAVFTEVSLPPYDTLPGRVRLPTPVQGSEDGQVVIGELPMFAGLDAATATRATRLVLGRYCLHPERLIASAGKRAGPYSAPVIVSDDDNGGRYLATIIVYADRAHPSRLFWRGWLHQLHRCG
jgi:hypothetical protein